VDQIELQSFGLHNILNALAVYILAHEQKLDLKLVRVALRSFKGVKRRQEVRGEVRNIKVIDDFAHHPTAVRETLRGLRPNIRVEDSWPSLSPEARPLGGKYFKRTLSKRSSRPMRSLSLRLMIRVELQEDDRFF